MFYFTFLNNLQKMTLLSKFAKVWENSMDEGLTNWEDLELDMMSQIIGLSCQLHMLLYIDWMLSTNLSLIVSLMFNNNH